MDSIYAYTFWIVWNPSGGNPSVKHKTRQLAAKEAERLARLHPNQQFFVLESVVAYHTAPAPVATTRFVHETKQ